MFAISIIDKKYNFSLNIETAFHILVTHTGITCKANINFNINQLIYLQLNEYPV